MTIRRLRWILGLTLAALSSVVLLAQNPVSVVQWATTAITLNKGASDAGTLRVTLGDGAQAIGSITNTGFTANAGTNLNTSALVLDASLTGRLPAGASPADNESNTNTSLSRVGAFNFVFDGSTWDRWTGAISGTVTANAGSGTFTVGGTVTANAGTGNFTVVQGTGTNLHIVCDSGCGGAASFTDNSAFTFGTTAINVGAGVLDDVATNAATENNGAAFRISANRMQLTQIGDGAGNERRANVTAGNALVVDGSTVTQPVSGTVTVTQGTAANLKVDLSGTAANATAIKVDGSAVTQPISGSVTANAGTNLNTSALALDATLTGRLPAGGSPADNESNTNTSLSRIGTFPFVFDGTAWDRWTGAVTIQSNAAVNVAQINGVAPLMGAGNTGTGSPRVTISTDQAALVGLGVYTEDVAETAGGNLVMSGSVRRDTAASSANASGDNATLNTDANGLLWTRTFDPCSGGAKTYVPFSISTATTTQLVAASASNKVYICSINLGTAAANNVALVEDDTSACASPTAGMAGGTTAATGWNLAANGGLTMGNGNGAVMATAAANRYVCFITSAATQLSGSIGYVLAP